MRTKQLQTSMRYESGCTRAFPSLTKSVSHFDGNGKPYTTDQLNHIMHVAHTPTFAHTVRM